MKLRRYMVTPPFFFSNVETFGKEQRICKKSYGRCFFSPCRQ